MGTRDRVNASNISIKNKQVTKYEYRLNDEGKLEKVLVRDEEPLLNDQIWNFGELNDDYYNAWTLFDGAVNKIKKKNKLETIDINAFGVGVIVDKNDEKFRHEVSKEWCSPPCKEFMEKGTCRHIKAIEEHNEAMKELQEKVGDATDPDAAFNRFESLFSNPENLVLMVEDEDAIRDAMKDHDKYEIIMLAKDEDGHPAIWVRPADAEVLEDGSSPDDHILTELNPVYAEKIKNSDIIGPGDGYAVILMDQEITLDDGKSHAIVYITEFDKRHQELDRVKDRLRERIEAAGKVGRISPEEGINSDVNELIEAAAHWPQLPDEYHDFIAFGRQNLTTEQINELPESEALRYQKAKEIADRIPQALDKTFMIKGWRESIEQFGAYYTDRKTGQDILSVDLFGPYGSGKTYFAEVVAELNNQPFYKIEASRDLDLQSQFVVTTKKYNPETGQSELVSQKAGLAQALEMVQGSVVLLDESVQMNNADQRLLNSVVQNAKYTATMSAEDGFTTHKVNRNTVIFTAHNTDQAGEGVSADNDASLSSRQATAIYFPPSPKEVKALQMARYAANMTAEKPINPNKAMLMVEFLDTLVPLYTGVSEEKLFRMPPNDPRDEKRMGTILARYCHDSATENDLRKAAELILRTTVNKYTDKSDEDALPKARELVLEAFTQTMNNPSFPFQWPEMVDAIEKGIKWSDAEDTSLDAYSY